MTDLHAYFDPADVEKQATEIRAFYLARAAETDLLEAKLAYQMLSEMAPAVTKAICAHPNNIPLFANAFDFCLANMAWNVACTTGAPDPKAGGMMILNMAIQRLGNGNFSSLVEATSGIDAKTVMGSA